MKYPQSRLLVFSKAPVPGEVKTRMQPTLSPEDAAKLHTQLTLHALHTATAQKLCPVELWCGSDPTHIFFQQCQQQFEVTLKTQQGDHLGQRMAHALKTALSTCHSAVIIGTDCPTLTTTDLSQAFSSLNTGADVVINPAHDGGYVLIGTRKHYPSLFEGVHWGSSQVFNQSIHHAEKEGLKVSKKRVLGDIDHPQDLTPDISAKIGYLRSKSIDL